MTAAALGITRASFGQLPDGSRVNLYTLVNRQGLCIKITDFGGIITEIHAPGRDGKCADVILGFDELQPYLEDSSFFGALVGRVGNRIAAGRFDIDGQAYQLELNNGVNHLHGGSTGFSKRLWQSSTFHNTRSVGLTLVLDSADGDQGYPGKLHATVIYELSERNELFIKYHAVTDRATPVNLTSHAYFNLAGAGAGDISDHLLTINADAYTPTDSLQIPTGELAPVSGTPFDFRNPHAIGARIGQDDRQLAYGAGYDHNYVINQAEHKQMSLAARVLEPRSGRVLEVFTQEPGVQFYSGNFLDGSLTGKGWNYGRRSGFCLETQHFPDAPNHPAFPDIILRPGQEYTTVSVYKFSVQE
ncbi:aldose epimerase family protein [Janthinobacterium agaricidamnosum]|uniref:Aldose 1-epimerase n=1 Tax=Janthinobacterium agaricidamnosum NBRC 102515 = DSM 9628 TaxID=1349767 RepID=W0VEG5_9BURK|nr:aldose epimerase family protein [Janthinobacterium agaricidamnosum]CDG85727.1 aldose 1-epimerase [Janthinobacterium agaricidamnosum NBRC 102515 = DSM 9628]